MPQARFPWSGVHLRSLQSANSLHRVSTGLDGASEGHGGTGGRGFEDIDASSPASTAFTSTGFEDIGNGEGEEDRGGVEEGDGEDILEAELVVWFAEDRLGIDLVEANAKDL